MKKVIVLLSALVLFTTACKKTKKDVKKPEYNKVEKVLTKDDVKQYTAKGKEIAKATFKLMSGKLEEKMKNGGPKEAVPFCVDNADELAKEIAEKYNVSIRRTSSKLRNQSNAADNDEKDVLASYAKMIKNGEQLKPVVKIDSKGKTHFYAPIKMKKKCLACHGVIGEEPMKEKTNSLVKRYHPDDKAIGYKEGDFRGIWSIAFNE